MKPYMTPSGNPDLEERKLEFEIQRFEHERKAKSRELRLRRLELAMAHKQRSFWTSALSPLGLAVVTAGLGIWSANYSSGQNIRLENFKRESDLIIEATKASDQMVRARNLVFFIESGLLEETTMDLKKLRKEAGLLKDESAPAPFVGTATIDPEENLARGSYARAEAILAQDNRGSVAGRELLEVAMTLLRNGAWEDNPKGEQRIRRFWEVLPEEAPEKVSSKDWSAVFVSYCLSKTSLGQIKPSATEQGLVAQFKERGWLHEEPDYDPQPGDIFFAHFIVSARADMYWHHSGIVVGRVSTPIKGTPVSPVPLTIAGNEGDTLRLTSVPRGASRIVYVHLP